MDNPANGHTSCKAADPAPAPYYDASLMRVSLDEAPELALDALEPAQLPDDYSDSDEKRVWTSVLVEAVFCYLGHVQSSRSKARGRTEALHWLFSDSDAYGSFLWVCDVIDREPSYVRRKIRALRAAGAKPFCNTIRQGVFV